MAKLTGLARLGRDAELRTLPDGNVVSNLALAFTYGRKGADGKRPTQWVDGSFWGQRAETLCQYLTKGSQVVAYLSDIHVEMFDGQNGPVAKLVGRVDDIELAGSPQSQQHSAPAQRPAPAPAPRPAPRPASGFDDMDDDIPF